MNLREMVKLQIIVPDPWFVYVRAGCHPASVSLNVTFGVLKKPKKTIYIHRFKHTFN